MAIYPNTLTSLYDSNDLTMQQQVEAFYQRNVEASQAFWQEADLDTRTEVGDYDYFFDAFNIPINRRRQFSFNITRPVTNQIGGYQRDNRKSIIAVPIENGDQKTADQFSKVLLWLARDQSIQETISESFHGALVTGLNLLHVWIDYRNDPINGDIRVDNRHYNAFMMDSYIRKPDLSDCNAILTRTFMSKEECKSLLPGREDLIDQINERGSEDGKFQFLPETFRYDRTYLLTYDEYYYRTFRKQKMVVDTVTNQFYEWNDSEQKLRNFIKNFPQLTVKESMVPTVNLAILVNGKVVYNDKNLLGTDLYPFVPVFAYFNPQVMYYQWRVTSVVRAMRDAQWLYNRRKVIELDIAESQITTGWKYKEDALVNPLDIYQLNGQGKGLAIKATANLADVEQIRPVSVDPSFFTISDNLKNDVNRITGVNEELMGSANDDIPGIRSVLKQGGGLRTLKKLFDQLDLSQKLLGRLLLKTVQAQFTPAKIKNIIQAEPTQEFYSKVFGRYDIAIEDGFDTNTQKQMAFAQALYLRQLGVGITDEDLLRMATMQDKSTIMENAAKQKEQVQQVQQMQMQIEQQKLQAEMRLINARADADEGLGQERLSRIQENQQLAVERASKAVENKEQGILNMAKAFKELDTIDLANFEKFLSLVQMYNTFEQQSAAATRAIADRQQTPMMNQQGGQPPLPQQPINGM